MAQKAATVPPELVSTATSSNSSVSLAGLHEELTCTICSGHFCDPVVTPGGITYCRDCIMQWLETGDTTCPITREQLRAKQLVPNYVVRRMLERLDLQPRSTPAPSVKQQAATAAQPTKPPYSKAQVLEPGVVPWQQALAAAVAHPTDATAWQLLGRCLAGHEAVCLQAVFVGSSAETCMTLFAQYTAPFLVNLRSLNFSHNHLTATGLMALLQYAAWHWPNLLSLNLGSCGLTAAGVAMLSQHAPRHWLQLLDLHLSAYDMGDAGVAALAQFAAFYWPKLQYLNLHKNNITAAGAAALAEHAARHWSQLCELNLSMNFLGDAGVAALAQHAATHWRKLQRLDLSSSGLGDAGVSALAQHAARYWRRLASLTLRSNNLTDVGVTALAQHGAQYWPELGNLDLSSNSVGVAGVAALAQHAAPHWPQLSYLNLDSNAALLDGTRLMQVPSVEAAEALTDFAERLGHSCWLRPHAPLSST